MPVVGISQGDDPTQENKKPVHTPKPSRREEGKGMTLFDRINAAFDECEYDPDLLIIDKEMERELFTEGSILKYKHIEDDVFPVKVMVVDEKLVDFQMFKNVRIKS